MFMENKKVTGSYLHHETVYGTINSIQHTRNKKWHHFYNRNSSIWQINLSRQDETGFTLVSAMDDDDAYKKYGT
jgi:hypothetical protein